MPIYDYHCKLCGADTEIMHKISDPTPKKCPECGKPGLVKQVSASGFRLSGGGWYETDFKSGGKKNLADKGGDKASSDKGSGDKSGASSDASSAKPASAKPAKSDAA